jgi:hypothetical protein
LKLVLATGAALGIAQLPEDLLPAQGALAANGSSHETEHEREAREQAEERAREHKEHEEERAREMKEHEEERAREQKGHEEERAREAQEHKDEQGRETQQHEREHHEHEHEHEHQEHVDNSMRCCYDSNCQSCEHPQDWCNKDAATCKDCGGKQLCTAEQIIEGGSGPSAGPSAWEGQEHQEEQDQRKQEHEQEHQDHEHEHEQQHQEHADDDMRCCYKANCQSCEHPRDWCNKDAATCKDCGGVQLCTDEQISEAAIGPSAGPSATEVLAEVGSGPQAAMVIGAFTGVALLTGVLRRSRRGPLGVYVPLLDEEATTESL